jgi:hypothetical protein
MPTGRATTARPSTTATVAPTTTRAAARITAASTRSAAVAAATTASSVRPRRGSATISRRRIRRITAIVRSRIGWRAARRRRRITWCRTIRGRGASAIRPDGGIAIVARRALVHDWLVHIQRRPTTGAAGWRTITPVRRGCRGSIRTRETLPAGCLASIGVGGFAPGRSVVAKLRLSV